MQIRCLKMNVKNHNIYFFQKMFKICIIFNVVGVYKKTFDGLCVQIVYGKFVSLDHNTL